eukprot:scaffold4044_cov78-Phaeocystis_antarctica.AAC.6
MGLQPRAHGVAASTTSTVARPSPRLAEHDAPRRLAICRGRHALHLHRAVDVEREHLQQPAPALPRLLHHRRGPRVVVVVGAARDLAQRRLAVQLQEAAEAAELLGVPRRAHVAAAAPALVAHCPEAQLPRRGAPVGGPLGGEAALSRVGEVLEPVSHLPHLARADVAHNVRLGLDGLAQRHELVAAEAVALDAATPVLVDGAGALLGWPDAVAPVVAVSKAAAGPAQIGDAQLEERLHHLLAQAAARVRHTIIDASPEVLEKEPKQVAADLRPLAKVGAHHECVAGVRVGRRLLLIGVDDRERLC